MGEMGSKMTASEESVGKGGKECGSEGGSRQWVAGTGGKMVTEAESVVAAGQRAWERWWERGGDGDGADEGAEGGAPMGIEGKGKGAGE